MGIRDTPPTRESLIKDHVVSMRRYASELLDGWMPFVSRRDVYTRVNECAREVEMAHWRIRELEHKLGKSL